MGLLGVLLSAMGLLFGGAGWCLTRADRLTVGQGTLAVVVGAVLVLAGLLHGPILKALASAGVHAPASVLLCALLAGALGLLLRQAVAVSRENERLRALAAETALQRGERE